MCGSDAERKAAASGEPDERRALDGERVEDADGVGDVVVRIVRSLGPAHEAPVVPDAAERVGEREQLRFEHTPVAETEMEEDDGRAVTVLLHPEARVVSLDDYLLTVPSAASATASGRGQASGAAPAMIDCRAATWLSKRLRPTGVSRARTRRRRSLSGRSIVT